MKTSASLVVLLLFVFAAQGGAENLVHNPGFEDGLAGWKVSCDPKMGDVAVSTDAHSGKNSLCIRKKVASAKDEYTGIEVTQVVKVQPKTLYLVRAFAKHALEGNIVEHAVRLFIREPERERETFSLPVGRAGKWKSGLAQYETGDNTHELVISLALTYSSGMVLFDDVSLAPASIEGIDLDIPALKPLCLKTPIVEKGEGRAVIVSSNIPAHQELAKEIVARVREATGTELPIKPDTAFTEADARTVNVITLGNLMSNKLVARLYGRWYARTDAWYPGKGGYEVRTIHDPWGTGRNVILLGGSDDEGVSAAVVEFFKLIKPGKDLVLDRLMNIRLSPDLNREEFAQPMDDKRIKYLRERLKRSNMRSLVSQAGLYAFNYYVSGNDQWAPLFRDALLEHRGRGELGFDTHMELWYALIGFDLVEESPALSEADRRELTKYLLYLCRSEEGANKRWFLGALGQDTVRHNHILLCALDAFFGGEYFKKYYKLEEADEWIENAALAFKGQERHSKTQCDANGYECFAVSLPMVYALAKPDMTFFESGAARKATERLIRCLDNMYYGAAYGDSWDAFWFPRHMVQMAHWYYRDPRYQYLLEEQFQRYKHSRWASNPGFFTGGPAEKPTDLDGVQAIPVDPEFFAYSTKNWKVNVSLERSFDKVMFREGLDPAAQYLLLDGLNIGSHGHMDANTIIEFSDRERIWLVDMSYTDGVALKDHNGVTAIKDGLATETPAGAELIAHADLGDTGFSRTTLHEHSGTDWTRNIFWRKGKYFLVLDEMQAREEGDFNFQCLWRVLGKPTLDGDSLKVEQVARGDIEFVSGPSGNKCALFHAKDAALEFTVELPAGKCALAVFGKGRDQGSDSVWLDLDGKRIETAFNLPTKDIGPSSAKWDLSEPTPNIEIATAGAHHFLVTLRESPPTMVDRLEFVLAGGKKIAISADKSRVASGASGERHDFFVLKSAGGVESEIVNAGPGFGHYWKDYAYAEPQVNVLHQKAATHLATGQKYIFANLFFSRAADSADEYNLVRSSDNCIVVRGKEEAVAGLAHDGFRTGPLNVMADMYHIRRDGFSLVNATSLDLGMPALRADKPVSVDLDLASGNLILTAAEDSEIQLPQIAENARLVRAEKGTKSVSLTIPDNWKTKYREAFAASVTSLASSAPKPTISQIARPTGKPMNPAWKFSVQGSVNCLVSADVDNDGKPETLVGSADKNVYLLDSSGGKRWSFATEGTVNAVCACDLDGDGRAEIIAGGDDANVYALDASGKLRWQFKCPPVDASIAYAHYGSKGAVRTLWAGVLEKGGKPAVVVGPESGYTFCLSATGEQLWKYRSGDAVFTSLSAADLDSDGNKEIIGGSALSSWSAITAINAAGKGRSLNGLDGWGSCLTSLAVGDADGDGKPEIVAATSRNKVHYLDSQGREKWSFLLGDAASCLALADLDGDGKQEIIAGSPSFYLYAMNREGKLLWRLNLGDEVTALCAAGAKDGKPTIMAGTKSGGLYHVSPDGHVLNALTGVGAVHCIAASTGFVFGTANGNVGLIEISK